MSISVARLPWPEPRRIAVLRALFLGDLLLATPALRALRQRFPSAEITLIGLPWTAALLPHIAPCVDRLVVLAGYPGLPEVPVDPAHTQTWLAEQRAYGYDLALQMHGDGTITNGLVAALGARRTLGLARPGDTRLTHHLPYRDAQHEARRWLELVAELGASSDDSELLFRLRPADRQLAQAWLARLPEGRGPLIAIHPGAKDPARRWPPERFAAVANALIEHVDARVVLTGSAHERDLTAAIQCRLQRPALDLAGQTELGVFGAVLARVDLLLTNDTGASHLAAALHVPSVVLFGPTRPLHFAPLDRRRHRVVDAWALAGGRGDPAQALQQLAPAPVLATCLEHLQRHARSVATLGGSRACNGSTS